jgi:hypothetical protein
MKIASQPHVARSQAAGGRFTPQLPPPQPVSSHRAAAGVGLRLNPRVLSFGDALISILSVPRSRDFLVSSSDHVWTRNCIVSVWLYGISDFESPLRPVEVIKLRRLWFTIGDNQMRPERNIVEYSVLLEETLLVPLKKALQGKASSFVNSKVYITEVFNRSHKAEFCETERNSKSFHTQEKGGSLWVGGKLPNSGA